MPASNEYPYERKGHSSIVYDNNLIIFGGCKLDIKCYNDLIYFNFNTKKFSEI